MSDGTTELLLADYELLESRFVDVLEVAAQVVLELPEDRIEYLMSVQIPFHVDPAVLERLIDTLNTRVCALLPENQKEVA